MRRRDLIKGLVLVPVFGNASAADFLIYSVSPGKNESVKYWD